MTDRRLATLCLFNGEEGFDPFRRRLDHLLESLPLADIELRLALPQASLSMHYALGRLSSDGLPWQHALLPERTERFLCRTACGLSVGCWCFPCPLPSGSLLRWLWYDLPVQTEFVVWIEESVALAAGWWEKLFLSFHKGADIFGPLIWKEMSAKDVEVARSQPWYRGVPFGKREGQVGVWVPRGGWVAFRVACLRQAGLLDASLQCGGPEVSDNIFFWLGAVAQQLEWRHDGPPRSAPRPRLQQVDENK